MNQNSNDGFKLLGNLQIIVTIGYIILVCIGILFTGAKYSLFGINVFNYSEVFDFLITPFKDMQIFLYAICPLIVIDIFIVFDDAIKKRFSKVYSIMYMGFDKKSWFKKYWIAQWLISLIAYSIMASFLYAANFRTKLENSSENTLIEFQDESLVQGKVIGTNPKFIFLINESDSINIIPINSTVKAIKFKRNID